MNDEENNNSIDDLITYTEEDTPEAAEEEIIYAEEEDDFFEEENENAYPQLEEISETDITDIEDIDIPSYIEENLRNSEEKKKDRGAVLGAVIGIMIGAAAIFAFISIDSGIIGAYKTNFANNFSHIFANFAPDHSGHEIKQARSKSQYLSSVAESIIVAPDDVAHSVIVPYKEGIIFAVSNHISYINSRGETVWETDTAIVDPLLAAEGNYILLAEKDRNKLCLYSDKKLVYDVDDSDNIMAIKVSAHGDAVAVTDKSTYRGGISVYNKSGEQVYSWASGRDTVVSADIASASRRVAVALLNTETRATSNVQLFDINMTKSFSQITANDTVIYNVEFSGSMLTAFGDNRLVTFTDSGKVITDITLDDNTLTHSAMDNSGNKLLAFSDGNAPYIRVFTRRGSQKEAIATEGDAEHVDINGKYIIYNTGRDIYFGKAASKNMNKYSATMDIQDLILLNENTYIIVYSNSLEIIKV